jgi:CBS domain containing-hemolysin-like protein
MKLIIESGFSRIPVFAGSFDNIKGILYIKDVLPHIHKSVSFNWQSVIRPPFFVPETKKINALLQEFQKKKIHLAIVIDEYGGTSGIVTLEDILEEIVGEIADEFDEEDLYFTKIDEFTYLFNGKTLIGDFLKTIKCDADIFDEIGGEFETIAGLILELKGEIPKLNDKIQYKQFTFTIEAADNRRILKIKVEIEKK